MSSGSTADSTGLNKDGPAKRDHVFPVDSLPPVLRDFVSTAAMALPVAPDLLALPCLVAAGSSIGTARRILLKEGWSEPAALYGAIVSPPGTIKTAALNASVGPIRAAEQAGRRTWTADVTVEGLACLLQDNPHGVCLIVDELTGWVQSMNQYKRGKGADKQFYLSAWSGMPITVDRKKDALPMQVPHPFVSVVGCVPPGVLSDLLPDRGKEDGFLHRVLFAWPDPIPSIWNEATVPDAVQSAYDNLIGKLYGLSNKPRLLSFDDDAKQLWVVWHDAHIADSDSPNLSPYLQGAYAKLKGYGARLALIHALCCDPGILTIPRDSVIAGTVMADYFKVQAAKVDAALCRYVGTLKSQAEQCKEGILRQVSAKGDLTKRDIQRSMSFNADIFNRAWDFLTHPQLVSKDGAHWHLRSTTDTDIPTPTTSASGSPCTDGQPDDNVH